MVLDIINAIFVGLFWDILFVVFVNIGIEMGYFIVVFGVCAIYWN